jgi:hypothetical protein
MKDKDAGKIGTSKAPADEHARLAQAEQHPYHHRAPVTAAERAALAVLADLLDRRVIGDTLAVIDINTRNDIVRRMALIIREAHQRG